MSIFKACDVRGVVGEELNAKVAQRIGRSLGHMMRRRGDTTICVGGDFRRSTPQLKDALIAGLLQTDACVYDVGQVPTPVVHFAARHRGWSNVAVVTASHNPGRYNGVKFVIGGWPAVPDLIRELEEGVCDGEGSSPRGDLERYDIAPIYERAVVEQAEQLSGGRGSPLRIVVDTMAGAVTEVAPRVLRRTGHHVTPLCQEIDPGFTAGDPNPAVDANLQPLMARVKEEGADAGIAFDGDGDRVILVDHTGGIVRPEQLGAILAVLCFDRPTVVYDLKCASVLCRAVETVGGTAVMRPSGYGFIKTTMIRQRADAGVEVSGHHFFRALAGGDDALFTALVVLNLVGRLQSPLADLVEPVGWPAVTPDVRIPFPDDPAATVERIAESCGGAVTRLDGVRAEYEDGWALARASITEPAITMRFEVRNPLQVADMVRRFLAGAEELQSRVLEKISEWNIESTD